MFPFHKDSLTNVFDGECDCCIEATDVQEFFRLLKPMILRDDRQIPEASDEACMLIDSFDGMDIMEKLAVANKVDLLTLKVNGRSVDAVREGVNKVVSALKGKVGALANCKYYFFSVMMDAELDKHGFSDWQEWIEKVSKVLPSSCENIGYMWVNDCCGESKGTSRIDVMLMW